MEKVSDAERASARVLVLPSVVSPAAQRAVIAWRHGGMASRVLTLKRDDVCSSCNSPVSTGAQAWWDADARSVKCLACVQGDRGVAGASAEREHERRRRRREARTRAAHPHVGGLLLALRAAPHHEPAFHEGAIGEQAVAQALERRTAEGQTILLHDRRMPRRRGNIDHLAVTPSGVFVIDTKNHKGKVDVTRPVFGAATMLIARRDHTKLLDGLDRQVAAVHSALEAEHGDVKVEGVLCFPNAELPLLRTLTMRGHLLLGPKALARRLNENGPLAGASVQTLAGKLAAAFPPA